MWTTFRWDVGVKPGTSKTKSLGPLSELLGILLSVGKKFSLDVVFCDGFNENLSSTLLLG